MTFIIGLVVGLFIGGTIGVLVMALMFAAGEQDEHAVWKSGGKIDE